MPDLAMLDYFYGDEAEQFTFYRIPKVLFTDPSYRRISSDAKILYGLMLDRMGLSVRNGWLDEYNRVFIFFTLEDALEYLCCGHTKAVSLFGELDKAGLIERKKQHRHFLCNRQHHNGASGHGAGRSVCLDAGNLGRILCHESDGAYHHGHFVWQDD